MAQDEEIRFRVIKDDTPVGIIRLVPGKGAFYRDIIANECDFAPADIFFIMGECCDYLELGIKVGDEWWFEGDIGNNEQYNSHSGFGKFTVVYKQPDICWVLALNNSNELIRYGQVLSVLVESKRIGNIHEEDTK